jgi:hypothetical protein
LRDDEEQHHPEKPKLRLTPWEEAIARDAIANQNAERARAELQDEANRAILRMEKGRAGSIHESAVADPRPRRRRLPPDIDKMAGVRKLVRQMRQEGLSHEEICERLGGRARPPRSGWRDLTYSEAFKDPKYTAAVRATLSRFARG